MTCTIGEIDFKILIQSYPTVKKNMDNDYNEDTHPAWIIVQEGKYSIADKKIQ